MPIVVAQAVAKIDVDDDGVKIGFNNIEQHVKKGEGWFSHFGSTLAGVFSATAIIGGVKTLVSGLGDMVKEGADANEVAAQTDAVLKSTHGSAGMTADAVSKLATNLMNLTGIDDDTVQSAENMLLTFTNIGKNVFPQATKTVLDMSTALGQDTKSSAIQLGKALNDPINGITALQRVGVTFNDQQKQLIRTYVQHGDMAKAQGVILQELQKEFGGSAEAAGKANGGVKILSAQFNNMKEELGQAVIPILGQVANAVEPLIHQFAEWLPGALDKAGKFITTNIMPIVQRLGEWFLKEGLPALQRFGNFIMTNVVPVLGQLVTWFQNNVLPALQRFAGFVLNNVVPVIIKLVEWFQAHVLPVLQSLVGVVINNVLPALQGIWSHIAGSLIPAIQHLWEKLSPVLIPVFQTLGWVLQNVVGPALGIVIDVISHLIDLIATIIGKLGDFLGLLGNIKDAVGNGLGNLFNNFPHFAEGGDMPGLGGMAMVGESGPELVYLPGGSRVVNAAETAAMEMGGSTPRRSVSSGSAGGIGYGTPVIIKLDGREIARAILPHVPNIAREATGSRSA